MAPTPKLQQSFVEIDDDDDNEVSLVSFNVIDQSVVKEYTDTSRESKFDYVYRLVISDKISAVKSIALVAKSELGVLKNRQDKTILHIATEKRLVEMMEILIDAGANIHAKDYKASTALHVASRQNHTDCVNLLLEHGARPHVKDNYGYDSLDYAKVGESKESLAILEEHVDGKGLPNNGLFRGMSVEETASKRNKSLSKQGSIVTDDMKRGKMRAFLRQNSSQLYQLWT